MKMSYLHPHKRNYPRRLIAGALVVALIIFLIGMFRIDAVAHTLRRVIFVIASPILYVKNSATTSVENAFSLLFLQDTLKAENDLLRESMARMALTLESAKLLAQENKELKEILGRESAEKSIVAGVMLRPPQTLYDTLLVDAGSAHGVAVGDLVLSSGAAIGLVYSVEKETSLVELFSSADTEIPVLIHAQNGTTTAATAKGRGGGNFIVKLPRDLAVSLGDFVTTPGIDGHIIGVVGAVKADVADAFETVLIRVPQGMMHLSLVEIITSSSSYDPKTASTR